MAGPASQMINIAIFASGSGSNAENIIHFFKDKPRINITRILTNNKNAGVIERAQRLSVPMTLFSRDEFYKSHQICDLLKKENTHWIVLAGFLWLVPENLIAAYPKRIINIHPALLPAYGGKGMYGDKVHRAVIGNGEDESGITIHFVNEKYDDGQIIFQAKTKINTGETPEELAQKIHALEYKHFPEVIENIVLSNKSVIE